MGKILAIDVGAKKIGLAIADEGSTFAFARPPMLVESWGQVWDGLKQLIQSESINTIVIGLPVNDDGSEGPQAQMIREFARQVEPQVGLPIVFRSEHGTSQAVQREQQLAGRKLERGEEDSLAAQLLLESYLQEQSS